MLEKQNKSLLPIHSQTAIMLALESMFRTIETLPVQVIQDFWNTEKCREDLLPYLANQLGIDFWSNNLDESYKRALCKNAVQINKHRGTIGGMKLALASLNMGLTVEEWFQYDGEAGTGKTVINLGDNEFSADTYVLIYSTVEKIKRLSFLLKITTESALSSTLPYVTGAGLDGDVFNIAMEGTV